jgi:hypothetical protein
LWNPRFQRQNYFSIRLSWFWAAFWRHLKRHLILKSRKIRPKIYIAGCW